MFLLTPLAATALALRETLERGPVDLSEIDGIPVVCFSFGEEHVTRADTGCIGVFMNARMTGFEACSVDANAARTAWEEAIQRSTPRPDGTSTD